MFGSAVGCWLVPVGALIPMRLTCWWEMEWEEETYLALICFMLEPEITQISIISFFPLSLSVMLHHAPVKIANRPQNKLMFVVELPY